MIVVEFTFLGLLCSTNRSSYKKELGVFINSKVGVLLGILVANPLTWPAATQTVLHLFFHMYQETSLWFLYSPFSPRRKHSSFSCPLC